MLDSRMFLGSSYQLSAALLLGRSPLNPPRSNARRPSLFILVFRVPQLSASTVNPDAHSNGRPSPKPAEYEHKRIVLHLTAVQCALAKKRGRGWGVLLR